MKEAVKTENLVLRHADRVLLDRVDISMEEGQTHVLLGAEQSGKSALFRVLACVDQPDEGDAFVFGKSVRRHARAVRRMVGAAPQENTAAPARTVRENLLFLGGIAGLHGRMLRGRVDSVCEVLALTDVIDRRASVLSGGYGKRLTIGMALMGSPRLLLLDEPFVGLDFLAREELMQLLPVLAIGRTLIVSTQDVQEAERLAGEVTVFAKGKVAARGTPAALTARYNAVSFPAAYASICCSI